jgi:hypothetical protein
MMGKPQGDLLLRPQPALNQRQVKVFVRSINLVADNGMAHMSEMDANLVLPARSGNDSNDRKLLA